MHWRPRLILIVILLALLLGLFQIYTLFYRPPVHKLNEDLQIMGLIDLDNGHELSLDSILNGEDAVLVVDHASILYQAIMQKIPQTKYLTIDELFNMNNLHLLDTNSDGIITSKDEIFKHLFIIQFYDKGNQNHIKTLAAAEIKGIQFNNTPTGDVTILMQDGTHRTFVSANKLDKTP